MDHLAPSNVPVYSTGDEQRGIWERCRERGQPVLAVGDVTREYVVRYDLQHVDYELRPAALRELRDRVRSRRGYPTLIDPVSETECLGGEAGPVSGALYAPTEAAARDLASHISGFVLDRSHWK